MFEILLTDLGQSLPGILCLCIILTVVSILFRYLRKMDNNIKFQYRLVRNQYGWYRIQSGVNAAFLFYTTQKVIWRTIPEDKLPWYSWNDPSSRNVYDKLSTALVALENMRRFAADKYESMDDTWTPVSDSKNVTAQGS